MISSSMMILLLYLPLPLRYKWAIWSEEEVQIYIQQKCFSVFFLFSAMMGPPFLVRVAQPTALFFSFQVPLVVWNRCLVLCVQYT